MKYHFLLLATLFFNKCTDTKTAYFIPQEFQYPDAKIGNGKIFVYEDSLTKKLALKSIKLINVNGNNYRVYKQYDSTATTDSTIIFNGKTFEDYNFIINGKAAKADIIQDTIINNGIKLGEHIYKCIYNTPPTFTSLNIEEKFLKDTSIYWQGKPVKCLLTYESIRLEIHSISDTSEKQGLSATLTNYYAKGYGIIKYSLHMIDHTGKAFYSSGNLESIKNIEN